MDENLVLISTEPRTIESGQVDGYVFVDWGYDIPISTHIFTEQSLCIAGSVDNCISVEHMPWFANLFIEKIDVIKGYIEIPERSGIGFTFNDDYINKLVKH